MGESDETNNTTESEQLMRVRLDTNRVLGGDALAWIDGRHTPAKQWQDIQDHLERATRGLSYPVTLHGVTVYTDNPNRRPYYTPGERVSK